VGIGLLALPQLFFVELLEHLDSIVDVEAPALSFGVCAQPSAL
jgi:hypothetical protein